MNNYIFGEDNWKNIYLSDQKNKYNIWIYIKLDNNLEIYLKDYKDWLTLNDYCKSNNRSIHNLGLRYRSHLITLDTTNFKAVYLVRSIKGEFGGVSKQCFTAGLINDNIVKKIMWVTPELIVENEYDDTIDSCFPEAIVYSHDKEKQTDAI